MTYLLTKTDDIFSLLIYYKQKNFKPECALKSVI